MSPYSYFSSALNVPKLYAPEMTKTRFLWLWCPEKFLKFPIFSVLKIKILCAQAWLNHLILNHDIYQHFLLQNWYFFLLLHTKTSSALCSYLRMTLWRTNHYCRYSFWVSRLGYVWCYEIWLSEDLSRIVELSGLNWVEIWVAFVQSALNPCFEALEVVSVVTLRWTRRMIGGRSSSILRAYLLLCQLMPGVELDKASIVYM